MSAPAANAEGGMRDAEIICAIARLCGWRNCRSFHSDMCGMPPGSEHEWNTDTLPDYLNDLNAMHEAEAWLRENRLRLLWNQDAFVVYCIHLEKQCGTEAFHATARQRATAFLAAHAKAQGGV